MLQITSQINPGESNIFDVNSDQLELECVREVTFNHKYAETLDVAQEFVNKYWLTHREFLKSESPTIECRTDEIMAFSDYGSHWEESGRSYFYHLRFFRQKPR